MSTRQQDGEVELADLDPVVTSEFSVGIGDEGESASMHVQHVAWRDVRFEMWDDYGILDLNGDGAHVEMAGDPVDLTRLLLAAVSTIRRVESVRMEDMPSAPKVEPMWDDEGR